ncbi:sugar transferase [Echinicola sediminis]
MDRSIGFFGLLVLSPLLLILVFLLGIHFKGNPFFFQKRVGKKNRIFHIIKFRTMTNDIDDGGKLLMDAKRLTRLGKFLRKYSLDELPQFINLLIGNMSLVGPRPLLVEYIPLYTEEQSKRHDVRPGITGLAQINGRNDISWEMKFHYDLKYVQDQSFQLDVKIIYKTIRQLLFFQSIPKKEGDVQPFNGKN